MSDEKKLRLQSIGVRSSFKAEGRVSKRFSVDVGSGRVTDSESGEPLSPDRISRQVVIQDPKHEDGLRVMASLPASVQPSAEQDSVVSEFRMVIGTVAKQQVAPLGGKLDSAMADFNVVVATDASGEMPGRRYMIARVQLMPEGSVREDVVYDVRGVAGWVEKQQGERLGWRLAVRDIPLQPYMKALIITDAHRGQHEAINARSQEAMTDWLLPPGFKLGYGRHDSPSDSVMQKALCAADALVKRCERENAGSTVEPFATPNCPAYESVIIWLPRADRSWDSLDARHQR